MIEPKISFLEASNTLKVFKIDPNNVCNLIVNTSASIHQLELYLRYYASLFSKNLSIEPPLFGVLNQTLIEASKDAYKEDTVLFLFPWDFLPSLDWRTGVSFNNLTLNEIEDQINAFKNIVLKSGNKHIYYLQAEDMPMMETTKDNKTVIQLIENAINEIGALSLDREFFCLKTYLSNGCPFSSNSLSHIAYKVIHDIYGETAQRKKIIVTDLDHTFWHGILGEDGIFGLNYQPEGIGYIHFIYQSYLLKLQKSGVLISICSKNDLDLVKDAFKNNNFLLKEDDFVSIQASYNSKSSQIKELAKNINLGLRDFVFIDDNPIEIEEVGRSIPEITCIEFPKDASKLPDVLKEMQKLFPLDNVTTEDLNRTQLYRNMSMTSSQLDSGDEADIEDFLKSLSMQITIFDKTTRNKDRAIQLINKTNQFNSNGSRRSEKECENILNDGGKIISASLRDKHGEHGEVIVILIDKKNVALSFVMSCRIFKRNVEYIFLNEVLKKLQSPIMVDYKKTERNKPFEMFLEGFIINPKDGLHKITIEQVSKIAPNTHKIFNVG